MLLCQLEIITNWHIQDCKTTENKNRINKNEICINSTYLILENSGGPAIITLIMTREQQGKKMHHTN